MGIIKVFTSQYCCEIKLDRIGLSFNLQVMQVEGAPRDGSYLQMMSLRLGCLESKPGPVIPAPRPSRLLPGSPMFLPSPPPPSLATPKERGFGRLSPDSWGLPERPNLLRQSGSRPARSPSWGVPGPGVHGPSPGSHPGARRPGSGKR